MKGFAALTAVLIIGAVASLIAITTGLNSIGESQISLGGYQKEKAVDLIDGCAEEALLRLNKNNNIPQTINLPYGTCQIIINSNNSNLWNINIGATTTENYQRAVQIEANRGQTITINKWMEL